MSQVSQWIYSADGTGFVLEQGNKGKDDTWLCTGYGERICKMSEQEFNELASDTKVTVQYPKLDAFLVTCAVKHLKSND